MGKDCKTQLAACQAALNPSEEPLDATSAMYAILALGGCALILRMWPKGAPDSVALLLFFVFWYVGNAFYNQYNTLALSAVGGKYGGLTMTVSTMQLGVCTLYAMLLWLANFNPMNFLLAFSPPPACIASIVPNRCASRESASGASHHLR